MSRILGNVGITGITDVIDSDKALGINLTGATSDTRLTLNVAQTADRDWIVPDASSTFQGIDLVQTITNKTVYDPSVLTISATGTTQGTAFALTQMYNVVTSVPVDSGVILQAPLQEGLHVSVTNRGVNPLRVYPNVGGEIDSAGTNNFVEVPTGAISTYISASTTQWFTSLPPVVAGFGIDVAYEDGQAMVMVPESGITNDQLFNSNITVIAGNNLEGGGLVPLGNTTVLDVIPVPSFTNTINAYEATATSGGTTLIANDSAYHQYFTGSDTETVQLPGAGTETGQSYIIVNNSTESISLESSGGDPITNGNIAPGQSIMITNILSGGTTAAAWNISTNGIFVLNSLTPQVQFLETGKEGNAFNIVSSGNTHTFNLPDASLTSEGIVTTTTQEFQGKKVFTADTDMIDFVACEGTGGTNIADLTINVPAGSDQPLQLMIATITIRNGFSRIDNSVPYTDNQVINTVPTGWQLLDTVQNLDVYPRRIFIYARVVDPGNEPASYTWGNLEPSPDQTLDAVFTASFSGTTMTVSAVTSGEITSGQTITGTGIPGGTTITGFGTGDGGTGTYAISTTLSLGSTTVNATVPKTNFVVGGISTFSNAAVFESIDILGAQGTPFSLTHSTPTVTTTTDNNLLLSFYSMASVPTTWTLNESQLEACTGGSSAPNIIGESFVLGYQFQVGSGTVGPFTATASEFADVGLTALIALRQSRLAILTVQGQGVTTTDLFATRDISGNLLSGFNSRGELFLGLGETGFNPNVVTLKVEDDLDENYTITLPNATTTLVGNNNPQVLENKDLTSKTNNIISRGLCVDFGNSAVSTFEAPIPLSGQVLTATSGTTAVWTTAGSGGPKFSAYSTSSAAVAGVPVQVPLNVERSVNTADFTHALNSPTVTINTAGDYTVHAHVTIDMTAGGTGGGARSESQMNVLLNGVIIPGTIGNMYHRNSGGQGSTTASTTFTLSFSSSDDLRIEVAQISGGGTLALVPGGSSLTITPA